MGGGPLHGIGQPAKQRSLQRTLGLPELSPENDRAMICGSPQMLADLRTVLDSRGFQTSPRIGTPGHYVFERAFVEK